MTEQVTLVEPAQLEIDAVLPQCLDNQYVSDNTYQFIVENEFDYSHDKVKERREQERRNEFIRSLIYSSQVVINRAFLSTDDFLIEHFLPKNPEDLSAIATLTRQRAIIPYLFEEAWLLDETHFDRNHKFEVALKALIEEIAEPITCVRLSKDDKQNKENTKIVRQQFRSKIIALKDFDEPQLNNLAAELFNDKRALDENEWAAFRRAIDELATEAFHAKEFNRHSVYQKFFMHGSNTNDGRFRRPNQDRPFNFEMKKIVDLVYNSNLPDALDRFTFTPVGLPSRSALQDRIKTSGSSIELATLLPDGELSSLLRRAFRAETQKAMTLPFLRELKVSQVVDIRKMDEWAEFQKAQAAILSNPLGFITLLGEFSQAFEKFQAAISRWYLTRHQKPITEGKYANFVTFLLQFGGRTYCAYAMHEFGPMVHALGDTAVDMAAEHILPKRAKGLVVKLLMGVYDIDKKRLDRDRSYSVELMRSHQEIFRDQMEDIYHRIIDPKQDPTVSVNLIADQGK
jgi:hypothetical protein